MTSIVFHVASTKEFHPRVDLPRFKVGSSALENSFKVGQKGQIFQLGFFERLMAFFKGPETDQAKLKMIQARKLMHQFGNEVRNFFLTNDPDIRRDCKLCAFRIAAELRKRVSNGTLEDFDALINPKLQLLMFQNDDAFCASVQGGIASEVVAYPDSIPRNSVADLPELVGAFYAEPDLDAPIVDSVLVDAPEEPISSNQILIPDHTESSVSGEFIPTSHSACSVDSLSLIYPDTGSLVAESRRREAILHPPESASTMQSTIIPSSKLQATALMNSPTTPPQEIPGRYSDFHVIEERAKHLLHGAADKMGKLISSLGKKADQLGEKAIGAFGMRPKIIGNIKSEAPVDLAITVVPEDVQGEWLGGGQQSYSIDQAEELPNSLDIYKAPEISDLEENPFKIAENDLRDEIQKLEDEARSQKLEATPPPIEVPESRTEAISRSESPIPPKSDLPASPDVPVTPPPQAHSELPAASQTSVSSAKEGIGSAISGVVKRAMGFAEGVVDQWNKGNEIEGIPVQRQADTSASDGQRAEIQEFGRNVKEKADVVASKGMVAFASGVKAMSSGGKATAKWLAAQTEKPALTNTKRKIAAVFTNLTGTSKDQ